MNTGIIFIHYIYLVNKYYHVNLIRAKSSFAETLRNAWNLNTQFDLIQNLKLELIMFMGAQHFSYKLDKISNALMRDKYSRRNDRKK